LTGRNASLHVDINPQNPLALPVCQFLGADNGQWSIFVHFI